MEHDHDMPIAVFAALICAVIALGALTVWALAAAPPAAGSALFPLLAVVAALLLRRR